MFECVLVLKLKIVGPQEGRDQHNLLSNENNPPFKSV